MYTIFIKKSQLFLSKKKIKDVPNLPFEDPLDIKEIFDLLDKQPVLNIYSNDLKKLWSNFKSNFKIIKASGGVVKKKNKLLFIFRLGKWDLPKGKIEKGEKRKQAAIREVEEECGITKLKITSKLPNTFHVYELNGQFILKTTYWYNMIFNGNEKLIPQLEEDITKVKWVSKNKLTAILNNTYGNIKLILHKYVS